MKKETLKSEFLDMVTNLEEMIHKSQTIPHLKDREVSALGLSLLSIIKLSEDGDLSRVSNMLTDLAFNNAISEPTPQDAVRDLINNISGVSLN